MSREEFFELFRCSRACILCQSEDLPYIHQKMDENGFVHGEVTINQRTFRHNFQGVVGASNSGLNYNYWTMGGQKMRNAVQITFMNFLFLMEDQADEDEEIIPDTLGDIL